MKVTRIRYRKSATDERVLAECDIVFDDELKVNNIRVRQGDRGVFVCMPFYRRSEEVGTNGETKSKFLDTVHPVNESFRKYLTSVVLEGYERFKETESANFEPRSPVGTA